MLAPSSVTPALSNAFRYLSATALRSRSVIGWATAISHLLRPCVPRSRSGVERRNDGVDVDPDRLRLGVLPNGLEPHFTAVAGLPRSAKRRRGVHSLVAVDPDHPRPKL